MTLVQKAVAAALVAGVAGSAHALDISGYASDKSVVNVYVGGSTAVNIALMYSNLGNDSPFTALCDSSKGQIDLYTDAADKANPHAQWMIYCVANTSLGLAAKDLAFFKESTLGSQNGSIPLYQNAENGSGSNATNPNGLSFINASDAPSGCVTATGALPGAQPYVVHQSCSFTTIKTTANITGGVSDVEAPLVGANPALVTQYLSAAPGLQVVWAAPVNNTFYRMLQEAEGLSGNTAGGVPSLTHAQLAGIYSGVDADVSTIFNNSGSINSEPTDAVTTAIAICRREFGSGTEASAEVFWLNEGCGGNGGTNVSTLQIPAENAGAGVIEETSTGNIAGCLKAFDGNGSVTDYLGTAYSTGGPRPAIGIISSENGPSTFALGPAPAASGQGGVGVVKVDGALPTLENVANGSYPFFSEDVLYNISNTSLYTGDAATVWNAVKTNIGTPSFLSDGNENYQNYWGQSGDLSPPSIYGTPSVFPATAASVFASPNGALTKSLSGAPDNCDPAIPYGVTATYQYLNQ